MGETICHSCLRTHAPACDNDWDTPCERCGAPIGGPAEGVPPNLCWRCHMGVSRFVTRRHGDAYDRNLIEAFKEPWE